MSIFYVRKTGSDGAAGTAVGTAWLTIDKAANTVAAGDTVYIGAGVYRELVTIDTSGSSGSTIKWRADIDGSITGDKGLVILTRLSDETGTGGTGNVLDLNGKTYNEFYDLIIGPSGTGSSDITINAQTGNTTYQGILFDGCVLLGPADPNNALMLVDHGTGGVIAGAQPTIKNCYIGGVIEVTNGVFAANSACGWKFINNVFVQQNSNTNSFALNLDGPSSGSFGMTGFEVTNNTFLWQTSAISLGDQFAGGTIGTINNNLFIGNPGAGNVSLFADSGSWTGANNKSTCDTMFAGTTANYSGSNDSTSCGFLLGGWVDHIYRKWFGWSRFGAFEQVWDSTGGGYKSGGIDNGSATYAPATDMYGNPRPMGRQNDDVGAVETRSQIAQKSSSPIAGTYSGELGGAGYHDFIGVPVNASSTTISVKCIYDANYTGTLPQLIVYNIPGVADQTDTMVAAANTEETLSVTFTPTSKGVVRVRIQSNDTSATGKCWFDTQTRS